MMDSIFGFIFFLMVLAVVATPIIGFIYVIDRSHKDKLRLDELERRLIAKERAEELRYSTRRLLHECDTEDE